MLLFIFAVARSAATRFQEKEQAIFNACRADLAKAGLTRDAAKAKYPTPEIHMVSAACMLPGGTAQVVVRGKFPQGTKFVFENDNIEIVQESLTANEYRATVKAAPGTGPQTAGVMAISPLTCITARRERAAVIGGTYEWAMDAANGWKITGRPTAGKSCDAGSSDGMPYEVQFFRAGESTPFEKRPATLYFSQYESTNYRFRIPDQVAPDGMEEFQAIGTKMADPKLSDADRQKLMNQYMQMQQKMAAVIQKMTDPAYQKQLQQKKLDFGCEVIELKEAGGNLTGTMRCSQKVGTRIALTGTMKFAGR